MRVDRAVVECARLDGATRFWSVLFDTFSSTTVSRLIFSQPSTERPERRLRPPTTRSRRRAPTPLPSSGPPPGGTDAWVRSPCPPPGRQHDAVRAEGKKGTPSRTPRARSTTTATRASARKPETTTLSRNASSSGSVSFVPSARPRSQTKTSRAMWTCLRLAREMPDLDLRPRGEGRAVRGRHSVRGALVQPSQHLVVVQLREGPHGVALRGANRERRRRRGRVVPRDAVRRRRRRASPDVKVAAKLEPPFRAARDEVSDVRLGDAREPRQREHVAHGHVPGRVHDVPEAGLDGAVPKQVAHPFRETHAEVGGVAVAEGSRAGVPAAPAATSGATTTSTTAATSSAPRAAPRGPLRGHRGGDCRDARAPPSSGSPRKQPRHQNH